MPTKAIAFAVALAQAAASQSPHELLRAARPLTSAEIATVLAASRDAIASKTLRLTSSLSGQGPELRMGPGGLPRMFKSVSTIQAGIVGGIAPGDAVSPPSRQWIEEVTRFIDYTGGAVRRCGGSIEPGELVIDYERHGTEPWTATARARDVRDVGGLGYASVFAMLRGVGSIESTEHEQVAGRWARVFVSPWTEPRYQNAGARVLRGDPAPTAIGEPPPNDAIQSLSIDVDSLLPVRWEVTKRGVRSHGFEFAYEAIDLQPPAGVQAPDCIR